MKISFLIQTGSCCWGRGPTLEQAAQQCLKAGAKLRDAASLSIFIHPTEDPKPRVTEHGLGLEYASGSERIYCGQHWTLGQLAQGGAA